MPYARLDPVEDVVGLGRSRTSRPLLLWSVLSLGCLTLCVGIWGVSYNAGSSEVLEELLVSDGAPGATVDDRENLFDGAVGSGNVLHVIPFKSNVTANHYRHKRDVVWDPFPTFEIFSANPSFSEKEAIRAIPDTRQRLMVLELEWAHDFVLPRLEVQYVSETQNYSRRDRHVREELGGCFYTGSVRGDSQSSVAVNLCHGMTGHIRTSDGSYFIEPLEPAKMGDTLATARPHKLYSTKHLIEETHFRNEEHGEESPKRRQRRSSEDARVISGSVLVDRYVEIFVVADQKMAAYHGAELPDYILTLMSIVQMIYRDPSIGYPINIAVIGVKVRQDHRFSRDSDDKRGKSASDMLRDFCYWQRHENPPDPSDPQHFDTALLITRENICRNPDLQKCDTLGLAELGTMCDKMSSCSIVQDNGLSAAFTIAHELGHVLNMPHDDDLKCLKHKDNSGVHNVMSRMLDHNTKPWSWSKCSRHHLVDFLDSGYGDCLLEKLDKPAVNLLEKQQTIKPGEKEKFNVDRQCELVFGPGSKICPYMPECKRLWCTTAAGELEGCRTQHMPWADGTPCGGWPKKKYCIKGECVLPQASRPAEPVRGGWGTWQDWSACSRSCGGGIQKRERLCNSPVPSGGGSYCHGDRTQYKSCQKQECSKDSSDFRALQCEQHNGKSYNIPGVPNDVTWVPKYIGIALKDRCKLFCRVGQSSAYYLLAEKVIDGTACGPDTDDMCVNGICVPAGCDHDLYSKVKLDMCGVCGGDSSTCDVIKGTFNTSIYGYNHVMKVPAGSSNIDIKQRGYMGTNRDDNYLALVDVDTGEYILNGNFIVSMFQKTVQYGGTALEYSGSDAVVERLNSTKPLKKDLIIQYTISRVESPREPKFRWMFGASWTECTPVCQGTQQRPPSCVQVPGKQRVSEEFCLGMPRQKPETRPCSRNCILIWEKHHVSECSESCGKGKATIHYQCVKSERNNQPTNLTASFCSHLPLPPSEQDCFGPCLKAAWQYGSWSPCTRTCGGGVQIRSAACQDENGKNIAESYCNGTVPLVSKKCGVETCPEWKFGDWTPCSETCGPGYRERLYGCFINDLHVKVEYCNENELVETALREPCSDGPCFSWKSDAWSECSRSCGTGEERRSVYCANASNSVVPDMNCRRVLKPVTSRQCSLAPCPTERPLTTSHPMSEIPVLPSSLLPNFDEPGPSTHRPGDFLLPGPASSSPFGHEDRRNNEIPAVQGPKFSKHRGLGDIDDNNILPLPARLRSQTLPPKWEVGMWSSCSSACGVGSRKRDIQCVDPISNADISNEYCSFPVPEVEEGCIEVPQGCAKWKTSLWSDCSVTCGQGLVFRNVSCVVPHQDLEVEEHHCQFLPKPSSKDHCPFVPTCPYPIQHSLDVDQRKEEAVARWRTGPWGVCSRTCGGGTKRRKVVCENLDGVESDECLDRKPQDVVPCNASPCPMWKTGKWKECNKPCGGGVEERDVDCSDHLEEKVADLRCDPRMRPDERRPCNEHACSSNMTYSWRTGVWNQCSKSCGGGEMSRDVTCVGADKRPTSENLCDPAEKKRAKKKCNGHPCPFAWKAEEWPECSHKCGNGVQVRQVTCHRVNSFGWMDLDAVANLCNATDKPEIRQNCNIGECDADFYWRATPWKECNAKCGKKGYRKRVIGCYNREGKRVRNGYCPKQFRLQRKERCRGPPCGYLNCADVQKRMRTRADGEYVLYVGGKNLSIYCHNMNTANPKEFLTLPKGERDNYAEYYDKRLRRPETCPYEGARRDDCDCEIVNRSKKPGVTAFSRIRLNVTSLEVLTKDFTFAKNMRGAKIAFGEAGDCYSTSNCPQGRFSINLEGTGLRVASHITWVGQGEKSSLWVNRLDDSQKVQGKCGGFCGKCSPDSSTGLKLDPIPT